jgi:hypothetical protein
MAAVAPLSATEVALFRRHGYLIKARRRSRRAPRAMRCALLLHAPRYAHE